MRLVPVLIPLVAAAAMLGGAPATARAQTTGNVECNGPVKADWTVSIERGPDNFLPLAPSASATLLSAAECLCNSDDLFFDAQRVTQAIPQGTTYQYDVWVGGQCSTTNGRSDVCEQITDAETQLDDYWQGSSSIPRERIPVRKVITPASTGEQMPGECKNQSSNALWLLFYEMTQPTYCKLTLPSDVVGPLPVTSLTAGAGDEAVNLEWVVPKTGDVPRYLQVLCADEQGNPLPDTGAYSLTDSTSIAPYELAYSTCLAGGVMQRTRQLPLQSSSSTMGDGGTTTTDGGTTSTSLPLDEDDGALAAQSDDPANATDALDAGVPETGGALRPQDEAPEPDGGWPADKVADGTPGIGPFINLDKRFVCSKRLEANTTTERIGNLENGKRYYFVVLSVDNFGNATPSPVHVAIPQPVEDLYRRFRNEGGPAQGFCFIATAAYGSYQHPFVQVLRDFRDRVLLPTAAGRAFVDWYYRASPPYAEWIAARPAARFVVRLALWPLIGLAAFMVHLAAWQQLLAVLALAGLAWRRRIARALGRAPSCPTASPPAGEVAGVIA